MKKMVWKAWWCAVSSNASSAQALVAGFQESYLMHSING
jgi:hypothetical protein